MQHEDSLDEIEEDGEEDAAIPPTEVKTRTAPTRPQSQPLSNVLSPTAGRKLNMMRPGEGVHMAHARKVSRVRPDIKSPVKKKPEGEFYSRMLNNLEDGLSYKGKETAFRHPGECVA